MTISDAKIVALWRHENEEVFEWLYSNATFVKVDSIKGEMFIDAGLNSFKYDLFVRKFEIVDGKDLALWIN